MVVQVSSPGSGGGAAAGIIVLVISILFMVVGILVPPIACVGCVMLIIGIVMISSTGSNRAVIIQQQPAMTHMIPAVTSRPVIQQPVAPRPAPQPVQRVAAPPPATSVASLTESARNLERARDFDAAAKLYQKAGMYEDAGRVRQAHLEKDEQAKVQIGQVGNKVLNDSVMVNEGSTATSPSPATAANTRPCEMCQNTVEIGWNVCPHCQHRFDR